MNELRREVRAASPARRQRACEPCSRSKSRCHFTEASSVCERCKKMGMDCETKTTKCLRRPRQLKSQTLHKGPQQHDDLSDDLSNTDMSNSPKISVESHSASSNSKITPSPQLQCSAPAAERTTESREQAAQLTNEQRQRDKSQEPVLLEFTWPQIDRILEIFRERYLRYFPFVRAYDNMTAHSLLASQPAVLHAIILVTAPVPLYMIKRIKRGVLGYLSEELLVQNRSSIDILQGLLTCLAWADMASMEDDQVTNVTCMALGCVSSLPIPVKPHTMPHRHNIEELNHNQGVIDMKNHSKEEKHILLGFFYLLVAYSSLRKQRNPLRSQFIECCRKATLSDFWIAHMVRMVQVEDSLLEASYGLDPEEAYLFLVEGKCRELRAELQSIAESLGSSEKDVYGLSNGINRHHYERTFKLYFDYLTVWLYEPVTRLQSHAGEAANSLSMHRSMCLRNCLFAAKHYLEILSVLTPEECLYQTIIIKGQMLFVIRTAAKLLLIDDPVWEVEFARMTLDLDLLIGECVNRLRDAEESWRRQVHDFVNEMGVNVDHRKEEGATPLDGLIEKILHIRNWFNDMVNQMGSASLNQRSGKEEIAPPLEAEAKGHGKEAELRTRGPLYFGGLYESSAWNLDNVDI